MKKIYTLLFAASIGTASFGQTVFQSDLSSWAAGDPTDWMGSKTSIAGSNVTEVTSGATYGTSMASLVNTGSGHKRFTTQAVNVVAGETYEIKMWVSGLVGDIRTSYYDLTNSAWGPYNAYVTLSSSTQTVITQSVTLPATCTSTEFILSLRNTDAAGIILDSVAISSTTPPVISIKSIYEIQYPANANGDSPEVGNVVTTKGVITGIVKNGPGRHSFFIQDSALAYNGLYIYEKNDSTLLIGDSVEVTGTVDEFNLGTAPQGVTELKLVTNITVLNSGNTLPTPVNVSTGNANMEEWEGVLIKVTNAQCTNTTGGFGKWSLNDASGIINADDDIFPYALNALIGTNYDVTGIGHYFFDEYSILPRDINDISVATAVVEFDNITVSVYPNPATDNINFSLNINNVTVNVLDITGKMVKTITSTSQKFNVNLNGLDNGIYFYQVIDNNNNVVATSKFIVSK